MKKYAGILIGLLLLVFGNSILLNIHNLYLRLLSNQVVLIHNEARNSGATGFIAKGKSGKKYIITNNHVCNLELNGPIKALFRGNDYPIHVLKRYLFNDLCAVSLPNAVTIAVNIAYTAIPGEQVYALGHPLLEPYSVTTGELSGHVFISILDKIEPKKDECTGPTYERRDVMTFFGPLTICVRVLGAQASTVSILPGNSGSPVVNIFGSVVGVAFAGSTEGVRSYIVPLEDLKDFLSEL